MTVGYGAPLFELLFIKNSFPAFHRVQKDNSKVQPFSWRSVLSLN